MALRSDITDIKCFEVSDSSLFRRSAIFLIKSGRPRDYQAQAARLAQQFLQQNRWVFNQFDIEAKLDYDGSSVDIVIHTGSQIGALPLYSPTTGKPDYGLVIKPRFDWRGLGAMLGEMGWKVIPSPLTLPLLPRSDRKIPPWVLSTIVLFRIKTLLDLLERRFDFIEADLNAPRGQVNWNLYATSRLPRMQNLRVPCRFPDLRNDQDLLAGINFILRVQLSSLARQRHAGVAVIHLLEVCEALLKRVSNVPAKQPSPRTINSWLIGSIHTLPYRQGIQAMQWTIEERGLAGLSDLQGLPWKMSMADFYEAWVETIAARLAQRIGGSLKVGRRQETIKPISWDRAYLGSQKYLKPDLIIERGNETIIIDAKFKEHWQELSHSSWGALDSDIREAHRADILQVLAYSTLYTTEKVTACLAYPCRQKTWENLQKKGQLHRHATVYSGKRKVDLLLTAVPMMAEVDKIVQSLAEAFITN
ncbi:MAG: hypothetical protein JXB23_01215 [Candidatus Aminicenantes bacterium]|nr:hypothetical protein [Candidatus Aminicenantes bacterium]